MYLYNKYNPCLAIIISCLLLISIPGSAQNNTSIEGKWKLIAMFDKEMYLNVKTDSSSINPDLTDMVFADAQDSILKLNTAKTYMQIMLQEMKNHLSGNFIVFEKNGIYREIENNKPGDPGTYVIDYKKKIIKKTIKRNNITVNKETPFSIKGEELHMNEVDGDERPFNLIFEKVN